MQRLPFSEVLQHVVFKSRQGAPPGPGPIPGTRRQTPLPFPTSPSLYTAPALRLVRRLSPPTFFSVCSAPYCLFCLPGASPGGLPLLARGSDVLGRDVSHTMFLRILVDTVVTTVGARKSAATLG